MVPADRSSAAPAQLKSSEADGFTWEVAPEDRIGAPAFRSRSKVLRRGVVVLGLLGSGYALYDDPARAGRLWSRLSEVSATILDTVMAQAPSTTGAKAALPAHVPEPATPSSPAKIIDPMPPNSDANSGATAAPPVPAETAPPASLRTAASAPATPKPERQPADHQAVAYQPYAPPAPSTANPYEIRAKSVGLHPDLSAALLADLSDADYRNAAIATRTAVAQTPDNATFTWPRRREPGVATFVVHFVPGAAADCRRYIVTVEKNKWLTTAPPVEKCGVTREPARPREQPHR